MFFFFTSFYLSFFKIIANHFCLILFQGLYSSLNFPSVFFFPSKLLTISWALVNFSSRSYIDLLLSCLFGSCMLSLTLLTVVLWSHFLHFFHLMIFISSTGKLWVCRDNTAEYQLLFLYHSLFFAHLLE